MRAGQIQRCEGIVGRERRHAALVDDPLELGSRLRALAEREPRQAPQVMDAQFGHVTPKSHVVDDAAIFVRVQRVERVDRVGGPVGGQGEGSGQLAPAAGGDGRVDVSGAALDSLQDGRGPARGTGPRERQHRERAGGGVLRHAERRGRYLLGQTRVADLGLPDRMRGQHL